MNPTMVLSGLALLSGFGIRYWINRRKFYRRSPLGAESFSSYEKSVLISFLERTGRWIAYILIIFGLLLLWSYSKQQKDNKVLIQKEVPFKHDQNPK
ncbi:prolipoprotein diacylglyceryltransferase [Flavobacterium sp. CG_9.1]|uniref:molybdenum ABC transporter permease n=1 Tax=Flavobacterium sp. CG_9.1 TaxID=2787728 RepID=UPI0018C9659D|nr:molybdenum ABC transporter permease [Flavobacterium sp. CG_9.1]MBG6063175.1 prolipoprotein diacylglyceryltransferase [Flavobacterium sp. CG_9.1]